MPLTLQPAMCRMCLQFGSEISTVSIFSIANGNVIADIVQNCLGIAIVKDSTPYENVCSPCIVSLVSMHDMYLKYQESNRIFIQLCIELQQTHIRSGGDSAITVVHSDVRTISSATIALEDIIEEDYSVSYESDELQDSTNTRPLKGPAEATFDEPAYCLQDFAGYVRQVGDMDGLLHTHLGPHKPQTNRQEWTNPSSQDGSLNNSLIEELNAQVARLDGQETTASEKTVHNTIIQPIEISRPTEMYPDRTFAERCQTDENSYSLIDKRKDLSLDLPATFDCYQEPKHHCHICDTSFQNDIDLVNHFPAHFLDVPQDCALCGTYHRTVMNLNRHMAYHQHARPYKCDNCERRFSDPHAYKWHMSEFHSRQQSQTSAMVGPTDASSQSLVCDICGKLYVLVEPYEQHVLQHEYGHQQYQCKLCKCSFSRNIYLLFHLETHAKKRPHRCQYCLIPFASLQLKNFHEKRHPNGDEVLISRRCPLCLTVCRSKHRLLAHIEAFHPADTRIQLLQCSFNDCRLKFLDLNEFQSHITDHRVGDRLSCTNCTRVFKRQRLLNIHLRTVHRLVVEENEEKRPRTGHLLSTLRCEECSKSFRSRRTYQLHIEKSHNRSILQVDT